jgi:cytochrome b561
MPTAEPLARYQPTAQLLHWLVSVFTLAVLPLGWVGASLHGSHTTGFFSHGSMMMLHKSVGIVIFFLMLARIGWRVTHHAPPLRAIVSTVEAVVANITHGLLYVALVVMPVSGFLMASAGRPTVFFGIPILPALPQNEALGDLCYQIHVTTQWVLYALLLGHVLGVAWHTAVRRDGLLLRILPPQRG